MSNKKNLNVDLYVGEIATILDALNEERRRVSKNIRQSRHINFSLKPANLWIDTYEHQRKHIDGILEKLGEGVSDID